MTPRKKEIKIPFTKPTFPFNSTSRRLMASLGTTQITRGEMFRDNFPSKSSEAGGNRNSSQREPFSRLHKKCLICRSCSALHPLPGPLLA
ncbi:hypothetical protein CDAR_117001 [Caerostris darwini]|uniref:Uncharacterized protein n=1 Tax=Caerostris darwini TaxID=1538125 RepID=A0AAV4WAA3_9ARAC|nr:hypothetical protein CDAR_117001 [Caerostris darwini]